MSNTEICKLIHSLSITSALSDHIKRFAKHFYGYKACCSSLYPTGRITEQLWNTQFNHLTVLYMTRSIKSTSKLTPVLRKTALSFASVHTYVSPMSKYVNHARSWKRHLPVKFLFLHTDVRKWNLRNYGVCGGPSWPDGVQHVVPDRDRLELHNKDRTLSRMQSAFMFPKQY